VALEAEEEGYAIVYCSESLVPHPLLTRPINQPAGIGKFIVASTAIITGQQLISSLISVPALPF